MKKTKMSILLTGFIIFCAAARAGAYLIYSAPDSIKKDSVLVSGVRGVGSYMPIYSEIYKLFNIDTHVHADIEKNPALLYDSFDTGNNESIAVSNSLKAAKHLSEIVRYSFIFMGVFGLFIFFGHRRYEEAKRLFDIAISSVALLLFSPALLLCAILIKLDSRGPVFFKQTRVGLNRRKRHNHQFQNWARRSDENLGKLFYVYKLRTMRQDAEAKSGPIWAKKNDNRVTRIGKILRKTHLDEIPQFYNVIRGEMSIIGPRPERPVFVNEHKKYFDGRFGVKPGITGLAQVRQSYAATLDETKRKLKYDRLYIKKQSIIVDIGILLNTFSRVVADNAAH